jgi:hypothetical protein
LRAAYNFALSRQREKFLYEQSRKFLLRSVTLGGDRRMGAVVVDTETAGLVESAA